MFTIEAGLKSLLILAAVTAGWAIMSSAARAQDDPNAQYILIQSGELAAQVREVEVPVEVGVWKLQFNLQSTGDVNWTIITPSDRPLATGMPNLTISNTKEGAADKRSILLWDPRPGRWKIVCPGREGLRLRSRRRANSMCVAFSSSGAPESIQWTGFNLFAARGSTRKFTRRVRTSIRSNSG